MGRLFLLLALSLSALAADNENTASVRVYAPTDRRNPAEGRVDALRLEMGEVPLNQLGATLGRARAVLPNFDAKHPPVVPYYMSRLTTPAERERAIRDAQAQITSVYPGVKPIISVRYLEDEKVDLEALYKQIVEQVDEAVKQMPPDQVTTEGVQKMKDAALAAFKETVAAQKAEEGRIASATKPGLVHKFVSHLSKAKAFINFAIRGAQVVEAGYQGPERLLSGVAMMALDPWAEYLTTRFEVQIGKAFGEHPLPLRAKHPFIERMNGYYEKTKPARFVKGSIATTLIYGIARPALNQQLGHWNNPGGLAGLDGEELGKMALAGLTSSVLYYGGFDGWEYLRQKGWVNQSAVELGLRASGMLWQAAEVLFSINHPAAKAILPWVLGAMWVSYGSAWAAGYLLPARNNRIVLVDSRLPAHLREKLNWLEGLESTREFKEHELADIMKLDPIKRDWLRRMCRFGMGLLGR